MTMMSMMMMMTASSRNRKRNQYGAVGSCRNDYDRKMKIVNQAKQMSPKSRKEIVKANKDWLSFPDIELTESENEEI